MGEENNFKDGINNLFPEWFGTLGQLNLLEVEEDEKGVEYYFEIINTTEKEYFCDFYNKYHNKYHVNLSISELLKKYPDRNYFENFLGMSVEDYFKIKRRDRKRGNNIKLERARIKLK